MTRPSMLLALVLIAACGEDLVGPDSAGLELRTVTTGAPADPDGYQVRVDGGAPAAIGLNATRSMPQVGVGEHRVELEGVASHCVLAGPSLRAVTVVAGSIARVQFEVMCAPPTGTVRIVTSTTGFRPDADGYVVTVNQTAHTVAPSGSVIIPDLSAGEIEVELTGVASNCAVGGGPSRTIALGGGTTFDVTFEVTCIAIVDGLVLFTSDRTGATHLYRVRDDGSDLRDLTPSREVFGGGDWSPDGSRIVFAAAEGLFVMNADGSAAAPLGVVGTAPRWSPDGERILFNAAGMITVVRADGTDPRPITSGGGAAWSPDGTRIAFARVDRSRCVADLFCPTDLYVIAPDGSGQTRLVSSANASDQLGSPAWSPDGTQIAYTRSCCFLGPNASGLYVVGAAGGLAHGVSSTPVRSGPVWSPDGRAIAVAAGRPDGSTDLVLLPSTGGSSGVVLAGSAASEYPSAWR